VISARELLSAIHPFGSRRKATLVLRAYFDDSGSHDQAKIISLAGFLGDDKVWSDFDHTWAPLLVMPNGGALTEFKTYDCVHGTGEFSPPVWNFAERLALAGRAVDVLIKSEAFAIGSSIVRKHFEERWISGYLSSKCNHPYYLCFEHCVQMAVHATKSWSEHTGSKETVALVFDEQGEFSNLAKQFYDNYKRDGRYKDWLVSLTFAPSNEFMPLQAADLLAYGTNDLVSQRYYPSVRHDFPVGPVFDRLIHDVANTGGGYDAEALDKLIEHMIQVDEAMIAEEKLRLAERRKSALPDLQEPKMP
jgi:hypothetical protein